MKELIRAQMNRLGFTVTRFPVPHSLGHQLRNFLKANQIDLVLDVGAHHGEYAKNLREQMGYRGKIVSFEPCASSFSALSARMSGDENWSGRPFGLSDSDSTAVLNTYNHGVFNSLLNLRDDDARKYEVSKASTETIKLFKLSSVWSEVTKGFKNPRVFLKIDTQGHDPSVVRGAVDHLPNIHGLQSELPAVEIYEGMMSMPDVLKFFGGLGYVPIGFHPVNTPDAYGLSPEFDVLFKRAPKSA